MTQQKVKKFKLELLLSQESDRASSTLKQVQSARGARCEVQTWLQGERLTTGHALPLKGCRKLSFGPDTVPRVTVDFQNYPRCARLRVSNDVQSGWRMSPCTRVGRASSFASKLTLLQLFHWEQRTVTIPGTDPVGCQNWTGGVSLSTHPTRTPLQWVANRAAEGDATALHTAAFLRF